MAASVARHSQEVKLAVAGGPPNVFVMAGARDDSHSLTDDSAPRHLLPGLHCATFGKVEPIGQSVFSGFVENGLFLVQKMPAS